MKRCENLRAKRLMISQTKEDSASQAQDIHLKEYPELAKAEGNHLLYL
jgi:hypothetical protein